MLEMFTEPRGVAVIGASADPEKLGYQVLNNVIQYGYEGGIYPINPKAPEILGKKAYPNVLECPDPVDMAVILVPNKAVPGVIEQCGQRGIKGAVIITAGFREVGREGRILQDQVLEIATRYGMRLIGPNVLGIIDTVCKLNASFAAGMPRRGKIAFMSQSGALCTSILDMALGQGIGFSRFYSIGNKADINELDLITTWAQDDETRAIMAYLEGITNGPEFIRMASEVTRHKPIIAIKSGTTSAGSKAVSSHTGSLAGSEASYDAAFKQSGIIRAESVQDLFDIAQAFARQPLIKGDAIGVITNAGGPGIMASDAIEHAGLRLATLTDETKQTLQAKLPAAASVANPVDVLGDAYADRYAMAIEHVLADPNVDALMVVLTPQTMTQIPETGEALGTISKKYGKPVFGCFMGDLAIAKGVQVLRSYDVPNYQVPERAVKAIAAMRNQRQWLNTPPLQVETFEADKEKVAALFAAARADGRVTIGDSEARAVLEAYGIPLPKSGVAATAEDAVTMAEEMGYPVVMKIASPDILHKSDIGGIKLNITSATEVRDAFDLLVYRARRFMPDATIWGCQVQQMVKGGREVIIGVSRDPQFGPLIMFGLGGIYVEVLKDVTFRVAPIDRRQATEMLDEIRSHRLLRGVRGEKPSDRPAIVETLLRISQLVTDFPEIVELDINPLMVFEQGRGVLGIDMRLALK